jgi:RimJ/RimL family protein N-acetyltransferase
MNHLLDAALPSSAPAFLPSRQDTPWPIGPRLRLREFQASDVPALVAMHQDPRCRALLVDDYPLHFPVVARLFLQRLSALYRRHEGLGIWHAEHRLDRTAQAWAFCGWFNLMPMPDEPDEIELGCRLCPSAWGQGLALEGGTWLLHRAFAELGRPRVFGVCHPAHRAAQLCLLALGFQRQGVRDYTGQPAMHFVLDHAGWHVTQSQPLRQRLREAVRRLRG